MFTLFVYILRCIACGIPYGVYPYSVGCFALLILFSGQCEKPIGGISNEELPTFSFLCLSDTIILTAASGNYVAYLSKEMKPIGTLIKEELERQERSITWFARKLYCDRSNVYRLFQKESIDTGLLTRISVILERDFFLELSEDVRQKSLSQKSQ